ncbi:P-loop containing nucleoside triphosphate hydrolase protein [Cokeromyces recurvatus]|uniref:P-loop containing nucleoside triphosphate hydrolase protein n=1 Tax=Cokeromyces recurvatus TaxID=90255 RepID=UPI00221FBC24|nr:P-loop containing nucleoside triphosphate hydrolase protein [Cokeromyces recurvatus]KAI7904783.1 P-loop containing nucleoside triphosphate hydrolase protein [Cokeromyces recurvatus]
MFASPSISPLSPPTPPLWGDDSFAYLSTSSSVSSSMSRSSPSFSTTTRSTSIRESIQVMVRCRPRSEKEQLESNGKSCWLIRSDQGLIELEVPKSSSSKNRLFYFDNVIIGDDNAQVYKSGIQDLVRSTMMGYNGTVFAYGQTASGKTYFPLFYL